MPQSKADPLQKIVNPLLAQAALNGTSRHGAFKAYVKLDEAGARPAGLKNLQRCGTDLFKAAIDCAEIETVIADSHILSVELREYVSC